LQEKAIPLILDGKDVVAKGRTGSGKTGAFAIPIIQVCILLSDTLNTGMHNKQPAGQMWSAEAFNMSCKPQNFVNPASLFYKNTF